MIYIDPSDLYGLCSYRTSSSGDSQGVTGFVRVGRLDLHRKLFSAVELLPSTMSHRKAKPKNKPSLSNPISQPSSISPFCFTSFHPFKPLFAATTTAIGQNAIRIYDTDRPIQGAQDVRTEIQLKRGDEVTCLRWAGFEGKKRKRANTAGELVVGVKTGRIYIIEQGSGEITRTLEGHTAPVRAWTPHEDFRGWSCGGDGKLKCWDIQTGSCLTYITCKTALIVEL